MIVSRARPSYTVDGKHIGTIKRFMIERQSGRIAYVVMSFGGFLDFGQEPTPFPGPAPLSRRPGRLSHRHHRKRAAGRAEVRPTPASVHALLEEAQEEELHAHFRIPPYWRALRTSPLTAGPAAARRAPTEQERRGCKR